jgi:hypothetical protein
MDTVLRILGILIVVFFFLASVNGVKKYVKSPIITKIAKQHRIFGMLATFTALIHMLIAVINGDLRITGALALISLIITGMMGMLFSKGKTKALYIAHRIMGPLTFVLIVIHIILNSSM